MVDFQKLLIARLQQQDIESSDLPPLLRDISAILQSKPETDAAGLNARLNLLGWHQVQLDYQALQLALAWIESEKP